MDVLACADPKYPFAGFSLLGSHLRFNGMVVPQVDLVKSNGDVAVIPSGNLT